MIEWKTDAKAAAAATTAAIITTTPAALLSLSLLREKNSYELIQTINKCNCMP